ncbi:MAG TPA: alanine dehydrogenase [Symbiobacteriaceae bacterium]|nr:alanine dehydrogenase [Symbiobacteriaceae bacterium]
MIVGVPKEVKTFEYRVALTPAGCHALTSAGHTVLVQAGAGEGAGFGDAQYALAGGQIVPTAEDVFAGAEMIVKVKEPQKQEFSLLRPGQVLFTYLHLAAEPEVTQALVDGHVTGIAYETVSPDGRRLPLLQPMSEIAGRFSLQAGARCLEKAMGGRGTLLAGSPGVAPGKVVVVGGGTAGMQAAKMAVGIGAQVTIFEVNPDRVRYLDDLFGGRAAVVLSNAASLAEALQDADLVVGAVLIPGYRAPRLITREMLRNMPKGAALVDIAIDQGGCAETSRPTTHQNPTYMEEGVVHYCVTNMPGAVARTSTLALTGATLPYVLKLAAGWREALRTDVALLGGLNTHGGHVTCPGVAAALGYTCKDPAACV